MNHICHAKGCQTAVPPKMWGCKKHWYMLPKAMRDKMWDLYVPGQEDRKDPTSEYVEHSLACRRYVAEKENKNENRRLF